MPYTKKGIGYSEPTTSKASAEKHENQFVSLTEKVFEYVYHAIVDRGADGMTCDEVVVEMGLLHQTVSSRLHALKMKGRLYWSLDQRPTRTNTKARIYRLPTQAPPVASEDEGQMKATTVEPLVLTAPPGPKDRKRKTKRAEKHR